MLAALYQNFVVNGFSVEGDQLKRYEAGQSKLAGILGLDPAAKMKVWCTYDACILFPNTQDVYIFLHSNLCQVQVAYVWKNVRYTNCEWQKERFLSSTL